MNKGTLRIILPLLAVALMALGGCKAKRVILKKSIKEFGFDYLYTKMNENHVDFHTLSSKFTIEYIDNKSKTSLKGQLRIADDSLIWASFSPALGIEAARVMLTDDSVKFINRLNKTYLTGRYALLDSLLNTTIDYSILQSMLLGNDLTQYDVHKFKTSIDGGLYRITIRERRKIKRYLKANEKSSKVLVQNIWLDPETFRIKRIDLKELGNDNKKLTVTYLGHKEVDGQMLPKAMNIKINAEKNIKIDIDYVRTQLNIKQKYPFRIPDKYELLIH